MGLLSQVSKGKLNKPIFGLIYAKSKVGKSTFVASAPDVLFLDFENSTELMNVERLSSEVLCDYEAVVTLLEELVDAEKIDYKSIGLDSLDRLELLIHDKVVRSCEETSGKSYGTIADIGYKQGYIFALPYWTEILGLLRQIIRKHKTHVMLIGHANVVKYTDPYLNEGYDKYEIKLHHKAADLIKESIDMILFMRKDIAIKKEGKGNFQKTKAYNVDERFIHTQLEAAFDAGSRIPLPKFFEVPEENGFQILLDHAKEARELSPKDLLDQIEIALKRVEDEDDVKNLNEYIKKNKDNAAVLRATLTRILDKTKEI